MIVGSALLVASMAHADPQLEARVKALEDKVRKLEAENARYAEALDFLQKVYAQQKAQQEAQQASDPDPTAMFAVPIANDLANGQIQGPADAPVTIVWAFDLADPYSGRSVPVMNDLVAQYKGKVRIVFKNMIVHPQLVIRAHSFGCAAGKQHKFAAFWQMWWKDVYPTYTSTRDKALFDDEHLATYGKTMGLDPKRIKADMAACDALVKKDMEELEVFHVNATPTFFINGREIGGAMPKESFAMDIDEVLKTATASGVPAARYYDQVIMTRGEKAFRSKKH